MQSLTDSLTTVGIFLQYFGERALLTAAPRAASVTATTSCELMSLGKVFNISRQFPLVVLVELVELLALVVHA